MSFQSDGEREVERTLLFYNLDAMIEVVYWVNGYQAIRFRFWVLRF